MIVFHDREMKGVCSGLLIDKSTVENPAQYSEGIEYVIVMGVVVKDKNGIVKKVSPGIPIKRGK